MHTLVRERETERERERERDIFLTTRLFFLLSLLLLLGYSFVF
jgi:hypothetical protein